MFLFIRRGIAVISKTQDGHLTNALPPPKKNEDPGSMTKSSPVPTTISSKATISIQTVQNVTFLLNNLLQQYDNSLRPDLGGKI